MLVSSVGNEGIPAHGERRPLRSRGAGPRQRKLARASMTDAGPANWKIRDAARPESVVMQRTGRESLPQALRFPQGAWPR